jgi:hypothetical protein
VPRRGDGGDPGRPRRTRQEEILRAFARALHNDEAKHTEETPHSAAQRLAEQRVLAAIRLRRKLPIDTTPEPLS